MRTFRPIDLAVGLVVAWLCRWRLRWGSDDRRRPRQSRRRRDRSTTCSPASWPRCAPMTRTLPLLHGPALASAREFRAQEQEHTNAIVKALRGLGEKAEPEEEEIESEGLKTQAEALAFLYEVESVSVAYDLRAISPSHRRLAARAARLDRRQPGPAPGPAAARARRRRRRIDPRGIRGRNFAAAVEGSANDRPPLRDRPLLLASSLARHRHLGRARGRPRPDRPGRRQQDQRKPDAARAPTRRSRPNCSKTTCPNRPTAATRW